MTFRRDAYIAAAGCVAGDSGTLEENAQTLTCLALEMQKLCATLTAPDGSPVVMRIGLHCGPLVGGVVGGSMLRYHLFGSPMDAVIQVRPAKLLPLPDSKNSFSCRNEPCSAAAQRLSQCDLFDSDAELPPP